MLLAIQRRAQRSAVNSMAMSPERASKPVAKRRLPSTTTLEALTGESISTVAPKSRGVKHKHRLERTVYAITLLQYCIARN
jgi:hypothetical protein